MKAADVGLALRAMGALINEREINTMIARYDT
jgi:hypothetical protein